jgi:predicted alpha/beta superfamily hydrolase
MEIRRSITGVFILFILLQNLTLFGQRISISGTEFRKDDNRIWLNGTNTPWHLWNDFGGGLATIGGMLSFRN